MEENDHTIGYNMKGTSAIGLKSEKGLGAHAERTLDLMIQGYKGDPAAYMTTFFENRVENAISASKFGNNTLPLPKRYGKNLVRQSPEDKCGIICRYVRMPGPDAARNSDMNDHKKVIEAVEFNTGIFRTRLQRGDYSISLSYGDFESRAVPAIVDAFREFKRRCDETGRPVSWEQFTTEPKPLLGEVSACFGSKDSGFELQYELFFQYEILQNFLASIGMLKVREPSRSP